MQTLHGDRIIDNISSNDEDDDGQRNSNSRFLCGVVEGKQRETFIASLFFSHSTSYSHLHLLTDAILFIDDLLII